MKRTSTIAIAMSILAVGSVASAQQSLKYIGPVLGTLDTGTINVNGTTTTVVMGAFVFDMGLGGRIQTYCADPLAALNSNSNPYIQGSVNKNNGTGLALAAKIIAVAYKNPFSSTATTMDQQAGLQLAIWDALYDNGTSFDGSAGNFKIVSGVNTASLGFASSYYTAGVNSIAENGVELFKATSPGGQDQLHVVPEPASLAVLGLGVVGLIRRRRTTK